MGHTKFFETWTFNRPLLEPFASEVAKAGKKPQWSQGVYQSIIICPGGNVQRCMPLPCVH